MRTEDLIKQITQSKDLRNTPNSFPETWVRVELKACKDFSLYGSSLLKKFFSCKENSFNEDWFYQEEDKIVQDQIISYISYPLSEQHLFELSFYYLNQLSAIFDFLNKLRQKTSTEIKIQTGFKVHFEEEIQKIAKKLNCIYSLDNIKRRRAFVATDKVESDYYLLEVRRKEDLENLLKKEINSISLKDFSYLEVESILKSFKLPNFVQLQIPFSLWSDDFLNLKIQSFYFPDLIDTSHTFPISIRYL